MHVSLPAHHGFLRFTSECDTRRPLGTEHYKLHNFSSPHRILDINFTFFLLFIDISFLPITTLYDDEFEVFFALTVGSSNS